MKIALVSGAYPRRELVARGISHKLGGIPVQPFSCCEDLLASSMDYQAFIIYNNFDHKMGGVAGVHEIRKRAPGAFIAGISPIPYMERQFLPAGADAFLLLAGNEITELTELILKRRSNLIQPTTPPPAPVSKSLPAPSTWSPPEDAVPQTENLILTLEHARLLLEYALTDPQPAQVHPHIHKMIAEIENIVARYYTSRDSSDKP